MKKLHVKCNCGDNHEIEEHMAEQAELEAKHGEQRQ